MEVTRTKYQTARYQNGKRVGLIDYFDSHRDTFEQASRGGLPIHEFACNRLVKYSDVPAGIAIFEVRALHKDGDTSLSGVRIYA